MSPVDHYIRTNGSIETQVLLLLGAKMCGLLKLDAIHEHLGNFTLSFLRNVLLTLSSRVFFYGVPVHKLTL